MRIILLRATCLISLTVLSFASLAQDKHPRKILHAWEVNGKTLLVVATGPGKTETEDSFGKERTKTTYPYEFLFGDENEFQTLIKEDHLPWNDGDLSRIGRWASGNQDKFLISFVNPKESSKVSLSCYAYTLYDNDFNETHKLEGSPLKPEAIQEMEKLLNSSSVKVKPAEDLVRPFRVFKFKGKNEYIYVAETRAKDGSKDSFQAYIGAPGKMKKHEVSHYSHYLNGGSGSFELKDAPSVEIPVPSSGEPVTWNGEALEELEVFDPKLMPQTSTLDIPTPCTHPPIKEELECEEKDIAQKLKEKVN